MEKSPLKSQTLLQNLTRLVLYSIAILDGAVNLK